MTEKHTELEALREALRMMGLDPAQVAEMVTAPGDDVCKAILLGCIELDEAKLIARVGEKSNLSGWRSMFERLRLQTGQDNSNP